MNKYERERILKDFSKRLDVLSYMRKIESYQIESLEKFIRSSPLDVIKELYDHYNHGEFSWKDIIANCTGIIIAVAVMFIVFYCM